MEPEMKFRLRRFPWRGAPVRISREQRNGYDGDYRSLGEIPKATRQSHPGSRNKRS